MQALVWIVRLLIVLVLIWFADKNADSVTIHGVLDQSWQAPLVFVILVAFVAGMVIGLLAWIPTMVRQRREIGRLRKSVTQLASMPAPPAVHGAEPSATDIHGI
ncbi:MAG TPA: LapA family protein [Usitatibacter sp.]|jgi:uncharacterized integral membrane protein|nr:LapA family protein [Usitatibacter sp.]